MTGAFGPAGAGQYLQFMPAFPGGRGAATACRQPLPKQLTSAIKSCTSLEGLVQLYAAHEALLNPIHIAAMITKLPKLDGSGAAGSSSSSSGRGGG